MFWKVLLHASQDEGLDLILLFPDQMEVMNLPGTIEALKHLISKTLENFVSISTFYRHLGDFLFSQLPVFFMKVTMNGKISLVEGMRKHRKTMRNKCPEQTLQVRIQYCIQFRSSLATMMLNYYILLSLFSCNYNSSYIQMYAAMFGWAMYQMMESNKTQIVWAKEEKLAS